MNRKRLCIVMGGHWDAQMGGAQFQAKCLVEQLGSRRDVETYYVANIVPPVLRQETHEIVPFGSRPSAGAWDVLLSLPSLYRTLKKLRPDVVYQRCLMPYTGVCALYCAWHRARFVFHVASDMDVTPLPVRGFGPRALLYRLSRWIGDYGLRHANVVVAQTRTQAGLLQKQHGVQAGAVVPNFHPVPRMRDDVRDDRVLRVIWVANLKPVKRPELFVELAEAFGGRTDVQFIMIGRDGGPQYRALHQRMRGLPNLVFLGELPLERVEAEIAASHVMVNTSSIEGFPNTFIQAWLRGLPVVSSLVDPDGCLSKGGGGRVGGEGADLAAVMRELLDDREELRRLGEAARAHGLANHRPERAQPLVDLLLDDGSAPRTKTDAAQPRLS